MGNISLVGATSGSITLSPTAVAGTNTITLPASTGTVALTANPTFTGTVTATTVTSPSATALTIQSAGTTAMTVDTSQNVGIGTTSPGRKLDIEQASTDYQMRIGDASGNYYDIGRNTSNGLLTFYGNQAVASGYVFSTVNGERARIDSSGNLLVGQTSSGLGQRFSVTSTGTWNSFLYIPNGNNGIGITNASGTASYAAMSYYNNGTTYSFCGSITVSGTSTAFNTSSDYRMKENVASMTNGLATIAALKPIVYDWISTKEKGEGFIAHELQAIIPLAVTGEKDAVDDEGKIKPQGVDYSKIVVHLVAAIQELSAKNDALEARLAALEAK